MRGPPTAAGASPERRIRRAEPRAAGIGSAQFAGPGPLDRLGRQDYGSATVLDSETPVSEVAYSRHHLRR